MSSSFAELSLKINKLGDDLAKMDRKELLPEVRRQLVPMVAKAVQTDLGDLSMSGWRRGAPIPIRAVARIAQEGTVIVPARRSAGPMRVLNSGRNGARNGRTVGKRSWDEAAEAIGREVGRVVHDVQVDVIGRHFRRG